MECEKTPTGNNLAAFETSCRFRLEPNARKPEPQLSKAFPEFSSRILVFKSALDALKVVNRRVRRISFGSK
jgi:hypothetical protein